MTPWQRKEKDNRKTTTQRKGGINGPNNLESYRDSKVELVFISLSHEVMNRTEGYQSNKKKIEKVEEKIKRIGEDFQTGGDN